ncbi:N terminal kinase protein like [Paragonimus heterotremus]|uniref:N-terminal kinase-like protein n=1 Tax=Paragonimus heterotremus TaxID=100268 RepID=A0A8J4TJQ2_9TREM|nr:N terminal kinase protein like [Paragonimus heterotremus]
MWLFSNKESASSLSAVGSLGLNFTNDPLPGFALATSDSTRVPTIDGPYRLEWRIRQAHNKKKNNEEVSLLSLNLTSTLSSMDMESVQESVRQTVKWMKTLRHPNILNWIAGTDTTGPKVPNEYHIVTERVVPLRDYLRLKADTGNFNFISSWGIHQISRALAFLNDDAKISHNATRLDAVFVTSSGEWKLGALDFAGPVDSPPPAIRATASFVHMNQTGGAPLIQIIALFRARLWTSIDPYLPPDNRLVDSWGLGCLIWEIFNPECVLRERSQLTAPSSLERLPKSLVPEYRRLVATNAGRGAKRRSTVAQFLVQSRDADKAGFFANEYVDTLLFLEEIQLKDALEKSRFLASLAEQVSNFPDDVCRHKILPHLLNGLRYGSAGIEALIPVLRLIPLLSNAEFETDVLPCLVKLFTSPERATRVRLLEQLPNFVANLPAKAVETQIFVPVCTGFSDANPVVRETTVRAMIHLAPKLSSKLLNDTLLRYLIGVQTKDDQGGIRTNATVCLAKLAPIFSVQVRQGLLLNAFLRATRDSFIPSRKAALAALFATQEFYKTDQLAGKLLPCLSFLTLDSDKSIRDETFRTVRNILDRLEQISEHPSSDDTTTQEASAGNMSTAKPSASRAAAAALGSLAWSALSFSSRLISSTASQSHDPQTTPKSDLAGSTGNSTTPAILSTKSSSETRSPNETEKHEHKPVETITKPMSLNTTSTKFDDLFEPGYDGANHGQDGWGTEADDGWRSLELDEPSDRARTARYTSSSTASYDWDQRPPTKPSTNLDWDGDAFFDQLTSDRPQSKTKSNVHRTTATVNSAAEPLRTKTGAGRSSKLTNRTKESAATIPANVRPRTEEDDSWGNW